MHLFCTDFFSQKVLFNEDREIELFLLVILALNCSIYEFLFVLLEQSHKPKQFNDL